MPFLFGFTIGPVQVNIQESKKLKDLYGSSKIISDLMKNAIKYILEKDQDAEIIYPICSNYDTSDVDITNYLICKISDKSIFDNVEKEVFKEELEKFKNIYFLFWAIEEIDERAYAIIYDALTLKLKSAKNTYHFEPMEEAVSGNCIICGKPKEKKKELCKMCQGKRTYGIKKNYNSTYSIAIESWKEKYSKELEEVTSLVETIFKNTEKYYDINHIRNIKRLIDNNQNETNQILKSTEMEEDLVETGVDRDILKKNIENIEAALEKIYETEKASIEKPHYNYCFLQVDVDNLGKWMSGKYIKRSAELKDNQKEISEYLTNFSNQMKIRFGAYIIYAGGDDLLAVLPPEKVFGMMQDIESIFNQEVTNKINGQDRNEIEITYTTSLTFVGCKNDMASALNENRKTLEAAKKRYEKDARAKEAVGINLIINSGKSLNAYMKKDDMKLFIENWALLKETKQKLKLEDKNISFAYIDMFELEFEKMNYTDLSRADWISLKQMMQLEFNRYLVKNYKFQDDDISLNTAIKDYIKVHGNLLERLIDENKIENLNEIKFDFNNLIKILRVYEKLDQYTFNNLKGEEKIETASN